MSTLAVMPGMMGRFPPVHDGRSLGPQLDLIEAFPFLVLDGVGADLLHSPFQSTVNGEIIRCDLDHGLLPGVQEGYVCGLDIGLY